MGQPLAPGRRPASGQTIARCRSGGTAHTGLAIVVVDRTGTGASALHDGVTTRPRGAPAEMGNRPEVYASLAGARQPNPDAYRSVADGCRNGEGAEGLAWRGAAAGCSDKPSGARHPFWRSAPAGDASKDAAS